MLKKISHPDGWLIFLSSSEGPCGGSTEWAALNEQH
jgi:hypothetical protein